MTDTSARPFRLDPPGTISLRAAFFVLWIVDAIAATLFFVVPYASELNPITVFFYGLFGLPGVPLAAICYAVIVVAIGHLLSEPLDLRFVIVMVGLYALFVTNNVLLLVLRRPPLELVGI
ncbi:hypothetical protein ACFO5R_03095 [Halosolutus amylolyticus]|uniref:DUF5658 domain-containing protein n=1 Tax=Halosolutus amylolyticus TaxID=2932267 RepID=A0ABD5PLX4_9EURY|nr:hypothetical protein [Halosolutus amylolyticus]